MKRSILKFLISTFATAILVVAFNLTATHHAVSPSTPFQRFVKTATSQQDSQMISQSSSPQSEATEGSKNQEVTIELVLTKDSQLKQHEDQESGTRTFTLSTTTQPEQTHRILELAEESGFFTAPSSLHPKQLDSAQIPDTSTSLPPSAIGAISISSSDGVFKREFSSNELLDNPAAQNMIQLMQLYSGTQINQGQ